MHLEAGLTYCLSIFHQSPYRAIQADLPPTLSKRAPTVTTSGSSTPAGQVLSLAAPSGQATGKGW